MNTAPVLDCLLGGEQIVLPHQSHEGVYTGQYYWPAGNESLILVCNLHGHTSICAKSQVHHARLANEGGNPNLVLWRAELECGQNDCRLPILVHVEADKRLTKQTIADLVFAAKPGVACGENHVISAAAHSIQISIVEF